MTEIFVLDEKLDSLPSTHDFIIKNIEIDGDELVFYFEDDITYHDSISERYKKYKTLKINYHLLCSYDLLVCKKRAFKRERYDIIAPIKLIDLTKGRLEFLYNYIGYNKIIIKLFNMNYIMVDMNVDYIKYEWIE